MGNFLNKLGETAKRRMPELLAAGGIGSFILSQWLMYRARPAAEQHAEEFRAANGHVSLTFAQKIQATWKDYIWSLLADGIGITLILASLGENNKRIAALATSCDVAYTGLREFAEYRKTIAQEIGTQKEAEIYGQTVQEQINKNPPPPSMSNDVVDGQAPKPICYDATFGRYFYCTYDEVLAAVNKLNNDINTSIEGYVSLNDFYEEIGVAPVEFGNRLGWSLETGLLSIPAKSDIQYAGTPNGTPCWVLEFRNPPQYEYQFFRRR